MSDKEETYLEQHFKRTSNSPKEWLLFTVETRSEGEEKVYNFIENILIPMRSKQEAD
jgi:hypothetical protein